MLLKNDAASKTLLQSVFVGNDKVNLVLFDQAWIRDGAKLEVVDWPVWVWVVGLGGSALVPVGISDSLTSKLKEVVNPTMGLIIDERSTNLELSAVSPSDAIIFAVNLGELMESNSGHLYDSWSMNCYGRVQRVKGKRIPHVMGALPAELQVAKFWAQLQASS